MKNKLSSRIVGAREVNSRDIAADFVKNQVEKHLTFNFPILEQSLTQLKETIEILFSREIALV